MRGFLIPCCIFNALFEDMAHSWFGTLCSQVVQLLGHFGGIVGSFLGHIVELEATKAFFDAKTTWNASACSIHGHILRQNHIFTPSSWCHLGWGGL